MTDVIQETAETVEGRVVRYSERPITFATFLELTGEDDNIELVNGVMVEQMSAQFEHETLHAWLFWILYGYVSKKGLGLVRGSHTAVEINKYGGRLPDLLFVRKGNEGIIQPKAIYGAPDLIIEIVSPNDRPSDIIAPETDYRSIGVPEIWFLDAPRKRARVLRKQTADYQEEVLTAGTLRSEVVPGFELQAEWLFQESRPDEFETLMSLLTSQS